MQRPRTEDLEAFVSIAEAGSVSRAASFTGHPRSTLTRRLERLERTMGRTLIERTHRDARITADGTALLGRARALLTTLEGLGERMRGGPEELSGTLRIAMPAGYSPPDVVQFFALMHAQHPRVRLRHINTDKPPQALVDEVDIILTNTGIETADWIVTRLAPAPVRAFASGGYLAKHGEPATLAELREHSLIALEHTLSGHLWPLRAGGHLEIEPWLVSNDLDIVRRGLLADQGITLLHQTDVLPALQAGVVQTVLEELIGGDGSLYVMYRRAHRTSPLIRAWRSLVEQFVASRRAERSVG